MDGILDILTVPARLITEYSWRWALAYFSSPLAVVAGLALAAPSLWLAYRRKGWRPAVTAGLICGPGVWLLLALAGVGWALATGERIGAGLVEGLAIAGIWILLFLTPPLVVGIPLARWRRRAKNSRDAAQPRPEVAP